jgi:group I intron endonuclease
MHTSTTSSKSYIGVAKHGVDRRLTYHLWEAEQGSDYHFHRALRAYGKDDFVSRVLEGGLTEEQAYEREVHYIEKYDTYNNGYNMTKGGDRGPVKVGKDNGMHGRRHTEEAKKKMSEKKKLLVGEKHPHYGKSSPLKGKTYEEIVGEKRAAELKEERRQLHLGRRRPYNEGDNNPAKRPEVRAKISAARRKPVVIDGVEYECVLDAMEKLGLSRYKVNQRLTNVIS